jgi:putative FmdB family regulatory protein
MPTYRYVCKNCKHELEELQSINDPPLVRCPRCGTDNLARVLGGGAGVIFKGSGFYLTDYGKSGTKKAASPEGKKEGETKKPETKTESSSSSPDSSAKPRG